MNNKNPDQDDLAKKLVEAWRKKQREKSQSSFQQEHLNTPYQWFDQNGKTAYQKGYEQVFGTPPEPTRPSYQGPVRQYNGQKSAYQQQKDDEASQAVWEKSQAETTLRFVYSRNRVTGKLHLDHIRKVQKGVMV